jgi:2-keto-4-pentenoate hydratase
VDGNLQQLARRLLADYDARTPGASMGNSVATTTESYALQEEIVRLREQRGERVIGYKVGCTSRTIQTQLGVTEPIFGRIFDTDCFRSGSRLSYARFANLAIEGELAVRLGRGWPGATGSENACWDAIEAVFPAIELHHYVLNSACPPGVELIASSGMHAGLVLVDPATVRSGAGNGAERASIRIDDVVVASVDDAASLPSPIGSLRWLARRLAEFGLRMCKGQVILAGSGMKLYPVAPGSRIEVEAPPLGTTCVVIDP